MCQFFLGTLRKGIRKKLIFRWALLLESLSMTSMLLIFFLVDRFQVKIFGTRVSDSLAKLNTSYFGYVALGLAVSTLANTGLAHLLEGLHEEKSERTFEYIMSSPISLERWAFMEGVLNFGRAIGKFVFIFLVAVLGLKLQLPKFSVVTALFILAISMLPLWSLAVFSLAGNLVFRRGSPISYLLSLAFEVLGGVYVPQEVLPKSLQFIGEVLPITPAIRAMQKIVYSGAGFDAILGDAAQTLILAVVYLPMAILCLRWSDRVCRKKGYY